MELEVPRVFRGGCWDQGEEWREFGMDDGCMPGSDERDEVWVGKRRSGDDQEWGEL